MSNYGKIWEEISIVRYKIKEIMPTANIDSLDLAKKSSQKLLSLIDEWESLEKLVGDLK